MNYESAKIIALADQYVDNNHDTEPIDTDKYGEQKLLQAVFKNATRLKNYHFVLSDGNTGQVLAKIQKITNVL